MKQDSISRLQRQVTLVFKLAHVCGIANLTELLDRLCTPREILHLIQKADHLSRHAFDRCDIYDNTFTPGIITYKGITSESKMPVLISYWTIRLARAHLIYYEPESSRGAHTNSSHLLRDNSNLRD